MGNVFTQISGLFPSLSLSLGGAGKADSASDLQQDLARERDAIFNAKQQALESAKATAAEQGVNPTLTDYFKAALAQPELAAAVFRDPTNPNFAVLADLSGQTINGFDIRKSDISPTSEEKLAAREPLLEALGTAQALAAAQQQQPAEPEQGVTAQRDLYDLDGDMAISNFYSAIETNISLENCTLQNSTIHPATTLQLVQNTDGMAMQDVTFHGLQKEETLVIGTGSRGQESFKNLHFEDIQGGTIRFNEGAMADGVHLHGKVTELAIDSGAQVRGLHAEGSHIVKLSAAQNASIIEAHFDGATIDMASQLSGSRWINASFSNANIDEVNFHGATLVNASFTNTHMQHASFSNASLEHVSFEDVDLKNVRFNGTQMRNVHFKETDLLKAAGQVDFSKADIRQVTVAGTAPDGTATQMTFHSSAEFDGYMKAQQVGRSMAEALQSLHQPQATPAVSVPQNPAFTAANTNDLAPASAGPTQISFDGEASLTSITLAKAVGDMERNPETVAREAAQAALRSHSH